jgi:hypothetical protein
LRIKSGSTEEATMGTHSDGPIDRRMRQRILSCGAAFALLAIATGTARAQPASSFEELRARRLLEVGKTATVEDASGRKVRGKVDSFDDGTLTLRTKSGGDLSEHVFAEAEVTRIRLGTKTVVKSTLIGAGVAFGVTVGGAAAYGANEGGAVCGGCVVQWSGYTVPVGAGIGALVGFVIDRSTARTVYDRRARSSTVSIAPVVGRGSMGAVASIRF